MTTPVQRMRALRWGLELLSLMRADQTVPETLRQHAAELQPNYPTPDELSELLALRAKLLPRPVADAIEEAGRLFEDLDRSGQGVEGTRRQLLFTLRHFPLRGDAFYMADFGAFGGVSDWLKGE